MTRGRRTTGRYDSRRELEFWVRRWYFESKMNQSQVAKVCGVSQTTAAKIINSTTRRSP